MKLRAFRAALDVGDFLDKVLQLPLGKSKLFLASGNGPTLHVLWIQIKSFLVAASGDTKYFARLN